MDEPDRRAAPRPEFDRRQFDRRQFDRREPIHYKRLQKSTQDGLKRHITSDVIIRVDQAGRIIEVIKARCIPGAERMIGMRPEQFLVDQEVADRARAYMATTLSTGIQTVMAARCARLITGGPTIQRNFIITRDTPDTLIIYCNIPGNTVFEVVPPKKNNLP